MIAVDTNVLVYAHRVDSDFHPQANECLASLAEGDAPWAIPWPCIHEFLAVVTHPRVFDPPSTVAQALGAVEAWIGSPSVTLLAETGDDYWKALRGLVTSAAAVGPRVHDARVAALCVSHGVRELWSADRDFGRFGALRVRNPLAAR